jgi:hypothetical protein
VGGRGGGKGISLARAGVRLRESGRSGRASTNQLEASGVRVGNVTAEEGFPAKGTGRCDDAVADRGGGRGDIHEDGRAPLLDLALWTRR